MLNNEQILEILNDWNFWRKTPEIGIKRPRYGDVLKKYLQTDEIIAVSGPRRSGKSTILLQLADFLVKEKSVAKERLLYINFEETKFFNFLELALIDKIWETYRESVYGGDETVYIFLDEAQKIKGWEHWARTMYDKMRQGGNEKIKIFVTGSTSGLMNTEYSNLLTGRHLAVNVFPLTFKEYLDFHGVSIADKLEMVDKKRILLKLAKQFMREGGFPKIAQTADARLKKDLLEQYFNDIIKKDIVERHALAKERELKILALFYAANFANPISYNKTKGLLEAKISVDSIVRFSSYLEEAYLFFFVPKFSYSVAKQVKSKKKVYIIDNGLRDAVSFKFSDDNGRYLENAVFLELKKHKREIFYFEKEREVDFITTEKNIIKEVVNVCLDMSNKETKEREIKGIVKALKKLNLENGLIITESDEDKIKIDNKTIFIKPFWKWALELE